MFSTNRSIFIFYREINAHVGEEKKFTQKKEESILKRKEIKSTNDGKVSMLKWISITMMTSDGSIRMTDPLNDKF